VVWEAGAVNHDETEIGGAVLSWGTAGSYPNPEMVFSVRATADGGERSVLTVKAAWLNSGVGGSEIVVSPDEQYAAVFHYSGESSEGYDLFRLSPSLEYLGGMDEGGEGDPPVFSPGAQQLAHIMFEPRGFLLPSGEPDEDLDYFVLPDNRPLIFEFADLRIQALPGSAIEVHPLRAHLPADLDRFLAERHTTDEEWLAEKLTVSMEFLSDRVLRLECTELAEPIDLELPITGPIVFDLSEL
jgi:hypothetical protein